MSQWSHTHPELCAEGVTYLDFYADLVDMDDGPKRSCPHCHMRSCWLGIDRCEAAEMEGAET